MTDAELLQHCKDEVARETAALLKKDWKNWADLSYDMWSVPAHLLALSDRAAKLAIQKAREEAWIDVDDEHLPARGEQVLLLCPSDDKKGFFQCVGFYAREKEVEAWTDDDDTPGIDYDVEAGITWLTEGFYTEEEQYRGECDSHYFERHPVKWKKLTAPGR